MRTYLHLYAKELRKARFFSKRNFKNAIPING